MEDIAIKINNISKSYKLYDSPGDRLKEALHPLKRKYHRDFYALKDISFDIKKGEMIGILGKNGSGKSTLLKLIAKVLVPSKGTVDVNGKISALLELGAGFNPSFTGLQNIYFYGTILGFSQEEMDAKIESILTFADIGDFIHQPIKTYSSGMKARLAFAVSTEVDPEILIIDEVLAVGDMRFAAKCMRRMHSFKEQNKTVIFVTHDANSVAIFCDRALWLKNGRMEAIGDAKQVSENYRDYMLMGSVADQKKENEAEEILKKSTKEHVQPKTSSDSTEVANAIKHEVYTEKSGHRQINWTDLSQFPKISSGYLNITHAAIYKEGSADQASTFRRGQTAEIFVRFNSTKDLDNLDLGWVLVDKKGLIACHSNSHFCGSTLKELEKNKEYIGQFTVKLPPLKNGNYTINIGAKIVDEVVSKVNDIFVISILSDDQLSLQGGYVILEDMDFSYNQLKGN